MRISKPGIYISLFFLCIFCLNNSFEAKSQSNLSDSIYSLIRQNKGDTIAFEDLYCSIIKNRRNLGDDYLPLMHAYLDRTDKYAYQKGSMKVLDRIGLQYRYDEFYDSALIFHNKSLELALSLNDSNQLYYNYNNLGQVYRMQDLTVQAISFFHKALRISDAEGDLKSSSRTMNTLGATYVVQKDYEQAMYYFRTSAVMAAKLDDKRTVAYNFGSMGEVFLLQNQNDSAMFYFQESKRLIVELGSHRGMGVAEHLIGQANFALGNIEEAEVYFNKALKIHNNDNNNRYRSLCYTYLGRIKTLKHKYDSAEYYLLKSKEISLTIHSFENLILVNNSLFELYKLTNKWENAVSALQNSHAFQDSILSIANAKQIQSIEIDYDTRQKEQKIMLLSAENEIKNQRMKMAWVLIVILILSIFLGIYVQNMRKNQSELAEEKLKQQLMLSQMNPHFIFNALGSIQGFMYKNEAKKAASYLGNFASLTRSILNNSAQEQTALDNEIDTLRNYIELEKMRMESGFDYSIIVPDEIDTEFIQIPPMLLQPFVENAIKHGFRNSDKPGKLTLIFTELNDLLSVEITDNGVGINSTLNKGDAEHKSMATKIFRQRMNILQKRYSNIPDPQIIDVSDKEKEITGTKVLVFLPIMNN